jgi:hypothetical protein
MMSAYFCEKATIDRCVSAAVWKKRAPSVLLSTGAKRVEALLADPDAFGRELWRLNRLSMLARYPGLRGGSEDRAMARDAREYRHEGQPCDTLQMIRSIDCWDYQSCEDEASTRTPLYRYMLALQGRLALSAVRDGIPEFEKTVWA